MSGSRMILHLSAVVFLLLTGPWQSAAAQQPASPPTVLKDYLRAMYARDAAAAYALVSSADKAEKSLEDYRSETGRFTSGALVLARELAGAIRFDRIVVEQEGDEATVTVDASLPDANAPELAAIVEGFDRDRLGGLDASVLAERRDALRNMAELGTLPTLQGKGERWELVREGGQWRVHLNWAEAVEVRFKAAVMNDLGWEFAPLRRRVLAKPGETIEMAYRVRNLRPRETTGKARHIIGPSDQAAHLEIISCFCFLEQTLKPGESVEMPLVFRVGFDAPENLSRFDVLYEFYPLKAFPKGAEG